MLRVPIYKFSHATDSERNRAVSWIHETQDLICVLDSFRGIPSASFNGPTTLKIVQRANLLEHLDLATLAQLASQQSDVLIIENPSMEQVNKLCFYCIYRDSDRIIAIKYNMSNSQAFTIRRLQMKFANDLHYQQILNGIRNNGCPVFDQTALSEQRNVRPQTASSTVGARPKSAAGQKRPSTAQRSSTVQKPNAQNLPIQPSPLSSNMLVNQLSTLAPAQQTISNLPAQQGVTSYYPNAQNVTPAHHGNAAFMDRFQDLTEKLPPRRYLPFPSRPSSSMSRPSSSANVAQVQRPATASSASARPTSSATMAPPSLPRPISPNPFMTSNLECVGTAQLSSANAPASTLADVTRDISNGLAGYASLSDVNRHAAIEEAIIATLRDENFVKFVEDFEGTWQRMGLDLQLQNHRLH